MRSELLIGAVLAAAVTALAAVIAFGATEPSGSPPAGEAATAVESPASLQARIEALEQEVVVLCAERDLLKRENARLVKVEKDRLAPEPDAKPGDKPVDKTSGKTYFVPDRDPAWWTDLAAFARDMRRRLALKEIDPDQALPAWLARLGDLAGTKVEWTVKHEDFSIRSILPEECLGRAETLANPLPIPIFYGLDAKAEAVYNSALQAAYARAAKMHGARVVSARVGPCTVLLILPVDALLDAGSKPRGVFKIVGRIVAVRGNEAGLEMFVDGTVSILPILPVAK